MTDGVDGTLVFVRHGESTAIAERRFQGHLPVPLSPVGERQAELVAARVARPHDRPSLPVPDGPPSLIIHSPLRRAAQTADAIARAIAAPDAFGIAVPIRPDDGLLELAQGEWEGLLASEVEERWADRISMWRRSPLDAWAPGGESVVEAQVRVRPVLDSLATVLGEGRVAGAVDRPQVLGMSAHDSGLPWAIVVGHDGIFKVALLTLLELPLERFWTLPFALCGISVVELVGGRARLRAHNLTEHLAPLEERAQAVTEERERTGAL